MGYIRDIESMHRSHQVIVDCTILFIYAYETYDKYRSSIHREAIQQPRQAIINRRLYSAAVFNIKYLYTFFIKSEVPGIFLNTASSTVTLSLCIST